MKGRVPAAGWSREIPVGLQVAGVSRPADGVVGSSTRRRAPAGADGGSPGHRAFWAADCSPAEGRREAGAGEQPHQRATRPEMLVAVPSAGVVGWLRQPLGAGN